METFTHQSARAVDRLERRVPAVAGEPYQRKQYADQRIPRQQLIAGHGASALEQPGDVRGGSRSSSRGVIRNPRRIFVCDRPGAVFDFDADDCGHPAEHTGNRRWLYPWTLSFRPGVSSATAGYPTRGNEWAAGR